MKRLARYMVAATLAVFIAWLLFHIMFPMQDIAWYSTSQAMYAVVVVNNTKRQR